VFFSSFFFKFFCFFLACFSLFFCPDCVYCLDEDWYSISYLQSVHSDITIFPSLPLPLPSAFLFPTKRKYIGESNHPAEAASVWGCRGCASSTHICCKHEQLYNSSLAAAASSAAARIVARNGCRFQSMNRIRCSFVGIGHSSFLPNMT
jgi:hypothetical protein